MKNLLHEYISRDEGERRLAAQGGNPAPFELTVKGEPVRVDHPKGFVRLRDKGPASHYLGIHSGEFKNYLGKDKDPLDVFIGDDKTDEVHVITKGGNDSEDKVLLNIRDPKVIQKQMYPETARGIQTFPDFGTFKKEYLIHLKKAASLGMLPAKKVSCSQEENRMSLAKVASEKVAYVFGASAPDVSTHRLHFNSKSHYHDVDRYHRSKAREPKTPLAKALLTGGAVGGGLGAAYGALNAPSGQRGAGAAIGGLVGGSLGALTGGVLKAIDDANIDYSKRLTKMSPKARHAQYRRDAVSALEWKDRERDWRESRRHDEMMSALRYRG